MTDPRRAHPHTSPHRAISNLSMFYLQFDREEAKRQRRSQVRSDGYDGDLDTSDDLSDDTLGHETRDSDEESALVTRGPRECSAEL